MEPLPGHIRCRVLAVRPQTRNLLPSFEGNSEDSDGSREEKKCAQLRCTFLGHFSVSINWSRRYAERIWGEFFILARRILGKLLANSQRILMANFDGGFFGLVFSQGFRPPKKIHAQNSRPELSAFLSNFTFLNPKSIHGDFLLTGETKNCSR